MSATTDAGRRSPRYLTVLVITGLAVLLGAGAWAANDEVPEDEAAEETRAPANFQAEPTPRPVIAEVRIEFKLDPVLTRSVHMGERWVSPSRYATSRQPGTQGTVEARAIGLNEKGKRLDKRLQAEWIPEDPDLVAISPGPDNTVTITIQRPGESSLRVKAGDVSRVLTIRAMYHDQYDTTQVEISQ